MTTYNTGNPVGSVDVRDLYDNAESLDKFTNGQLDEYADRLGVSRKSLAGMEAEFDAEQVDRAAQWAAFLLASGYQVLGPYGAGLVFTAPNQLFSYLGEFYSPGPSIVLPYTTSGAGAGEIANFRPAGEAILRSDMANSADPAKGAALVGFSSETVYSALNRALASNTLDTTRIDVPSADTVNLTNSAPNTRHINITGTTGITSFTVAAGRCYFVRFAGTLTLTNNASIVTQSGANITTAAGDTCIVRATAANVVEVLAYTPVTALLDTTRIDVPSADTVNLTASAPNTRHINITGATTITAFTVAVGRCYFVRFAGALTLTNNANIVTQTGANITTAAGDTCILRATAANVVEVLAYTPFLNQAVGYGQTWQDVTGSRTIGTIYTNSTGKPIALNVYSVQSAASLITATVAGVPVKGSQSQIGGGHSVFAIVPNGATYSVTVSGGTTSGLSWIELR